MQKTSVTISVSMLAAAVFGAFFRWLQIHNGFDPETGCAIPYAGTAILFLLYSIAVAAAVCALAVILCRRFSCRRDALALGSGNPATVTVGWIFGVAFALCAAAFLFSTGLVRFPLFRRITGAGGILAGLCFPLMMSRLKDRESGRTVRTAAMIVTLFYCLWLIYAYRINSENPTIWRIAVEMLAIASGAMSFYYVTGFFFGQGIPGRAIAALMLGVYFNVTVLFEERSLAQTGMFALTAAMCTAMLLRLLRHLEPKTQEE